MRVASPNHQAIFSRIRRLPPWQLEEDLRAYYNGYCFAAGGELVYNPFSLLLCLRTRRLDEFWFDTATPAFLIQLLQNNRVDLTDLDGWKAPDDVFGVYDLDSLDPIALLFQTGYLTIKGRLADDTFGSGIGIFLDYGTFWDGATFFRASSPSVFSPVAGKKPESPVR